MGCISQIHEIVSGWPIWRDSGDWEKLLKAWHPDGRITTTWFQGSAEEFVRRSRQAWEAGSIVHHIQGSSSVEVAGPRAIAQTRMILCARGVVDGVECDVQCIGRFYDFFEERGGRWGLSFRQPIYEKDRLDPVDPAERLHLRPEILKRFPPGYRHLAYLQTALGQVVMDGLPGLRGPEVERVYARGRNWLDGSEGLGTIGVVAIDGGQDLSAS